MLFTWHLATIMLPSATHCTDSSPRGHKYDLRVDPLDMALHVEHKMPNQATNPLGSDCKIATIAVLGANLFGSVGGLRHERLKEKLG